jgi:hypothetical protein
MVTRSSIFSSRYVHLIWGLAFLVAMPPLMGIGDYVVDVGMIR